MYLPESNIENDITSFWSSPSRPNGLPRNKAPTNLDSARSRLAFYQSDPSAGQEAELARYDIFADDLYLGEIEFTDPLQMICDRSPSGNRIAFAKWTYFPDEGNNKIFWFDLHDLELFSHVLPEMALYWIGFSPDNRFLGMSGFSEGDERNRFILLDTETGISQTLPISVSYNRLAWSPDGNQILVLEEAGSSFDLEVRRTLNVYSASEGQLLDQVKVDVVSLGIDHLKIQYDDGEVEFYLSIQDIASCTARPLKISKPKISKPIISE